MMGEEDGDTLAAGGRALRAAAEEGSLPVVRALLAAGADVNVREEPDEPSALMLACQGGHSALAHLTRGARRCVSSDGGRLDRAHAGVPGRQRADRG